MNASKPRLILLLAVALSAFLFGCATKRPVENAIFFPPSPDEPRIQYLMSFGSETDLGGQSKFSKFVTGEHTVYRPIWKPYGVTVKNGRIYVCDTQAGNVSVTDFAKSKLRYLKPEGQAAMKLPVNVAVDDNDLIYVTDTVREQLLVYDQKGNLVEAVGKRDEMKPCGLALYKDRIYLTDLKSHTVRVYNLGTRQFQFAFPKAGDEKARLFQPTNLCIDKDGRVIVCDSGGFCIKTFDTEGNYLQGFGDLGVTPGQFTLPKGVAADREGRIYVVDAAAPVIQLFQADSKLLMFFGEPGKSGRAGLYLPAGIAITYDDVGMFDRFVAPGQKLEYVILVCNQAGPNKVSAYGFLKK